jgi:signal transduction histidine kinase
MRLGSASRQRAANTETKVRREAGTRLSGRWLLVARVGWIALVAFSLSVSVASLPLYMAQLRTVSGNGVYIPWQLLPANAQALQHLGISLDVYAACATVLSLSLALIWLAVGGVLFWRKSDDWMALLVALALVLEGTGFTRALLDPSGLTLRCLSLLSNAATLLVFSLFPNGRFAPRWMGWLVLVAIPLSGGDQNFFPDSPLNPNTWPAPLGDVFFIGFIGCLIGSQIYRYRRVSSPVQRQQTKWVVFALTAIFLGMAVDVFVVDVLPHFFPSLGPSDLLTQMLSAVEFTLFNVFFPLSIGIAILRYRLWDIDIFINRTLVYGILTVSVVALYILVVVGLGALFQAQGNLAISLLATGLIAVLFQPLRNRLQRAVNRLMYGERDDPYRVISRLGQRLEATLAPDSVLPTIVDTVAQALKLPYAAITLQQGDEFTIAASYGSLKDKPVRLPLVYQTEQVGELVLAPRAPGESFTPADRVLLDDLARQAGIAAYAVRLTADLKRLTADLQHSRERLVTAREEERRRLRRDLHDGLGPQLASLTLKLETARNRLAHDSLADTLLTDLARRTQATITDIRRLVYALRPPTLDELGLVSALRELILQYNDQVSMRFDAPDCLPELPAAVEVAVYRISQEALTNVVHHAHAHRSDLRLALDETEGLLSLSIQDDGCGLPPSRSVGVGLTSMRERAEELGGTWLIEQVPTGGTRVLARLPSMLSETADTLVVIPSVVPQEEV